jgi:hypothetical protein
MNVIGPNKREMSNVIAQLRHLYMHLAKHDDAAVRSMAEGLLARQIKRLESLDRVLFDDPPTALEAEILRLQEEEMAVCNCGNENCPTRHGIHLRPRATAPTPEAIPARVARARSAVGVFRDAARMGRVIEGRERDPLVMDIHWALDALEAEVARLTQEQEKK